MKQKTPKDSEILKTTHEGFTIDLPIYPNNLDNRQRPKEIEKLYNKWEQRDRLALYFQIKDAGVLRPVTDLDFDAFLKEKISTSSLDGKNESVESKLKAIKDKINDLIIIHEKNSGSDRNHNLIGLAKRFLKAIKMQPVQAIQAPAIAAFCQILRDSETENDAKNNLIYCKKICEKYNLKYTEKVRQHFSGKPTPKHIDEVKSLILPTINKDIRQKIEAHLNTKNKMYG